MSTRLHRQHLLVQTLVLAACTSFWGGLSSIALGQDLPSSLVGKVSDLDAGEQAKIAELIDARGAQLASEKPSEVTAARSALAKPLLDRGASVPFRAAYSAKLAPVLRDHLRATDAKDTLVFNSLRLAGDLATAASLDLIDAALKSEKATTRYAASHALGRALLAVERASPAVDAGRLKQSVDRLAAILRTEKDVKVLDSAVRSLAQGGKVTRGVVAEIREGSLRALSSNLSERIREIKPEDVDQGIQDVLLRAGTLVRDALIDARNIKPLLSDAALKDMAGLGGDLLALSGRMLKAPALVPILRSDDEDEQARKRALRVGPAKIAAAGEAVIASADLQNPVASTDHFKLLNDATNENDARFLEAVKELIGTNGRLSKPPFSFAPDRFVK